jgi:hypothetical protein
MREAGGGREGEGELLKRRKGSEAALVRSAECALVGARTDYIQVLAETTLGLQVICGQDKLLID